MSLIKDKRFKWKIKARSSPLYGSWSNMIRRCLNSKASDYSYYGERGVTVCKRWMSFDSFYNDMSIGWRSGLTLDRIDVNGNYNKRNCRWVTRKEQAINRRSTHFIINPENGHKKSITDWAIFFGINQRTIRSRIRLGHKDFKILMLKPSGRGCNSIKRAVVD